MRKFRLLLILMSALLSWQCFDPPAEPVLPSWDTDISLPLANRTYLLEELIEKNPDILDVDAHGTILYSFSDTVQNDPFGDLIRLKPEPAAFEFEVGTYTLHPDDLDFDVPVGEEIGLPPGYQGNSPGVSLTHMSGAVPEIESIRYMVIETGKSYLSLRNDSGLPVQFDDGVRFTNSDDNSSVAHFVYTDIIEPGEEVEVEVQLTDTRVYRELEYEYEFSSPPADDVEIPEDPSFQFVFGFTELEVNEAEARIPEQTLDGNHTGEIVIDDSTYITSIVFSHGMLDVVVENTIDLDIPVTFRFPELRNRTNPSQEYQVSENLESGSVTVFPVDLTEWMIQTSSLKNSISYTIDLGTIDATDDFRSFHASDGINGTVQPHDPPHDELVVEQVEGMIAPTQYEVLEHIELDIGDVADYFKGDITFNNIELILGLLFDGGFDALANIRIVGENKHGVRASIEVPADQQFITAGDWTMIVLDKTNSTIDEFFSTFIPDLPGELQVTGELIVNPDYSTGSIDVNSTLLSSIQLDMPFDIGVQDGMVSDTLSISNDDDDFDGEIFDYINYGRLYFETENGIPAGMDLRINVMNGSGAVMRSFPLEGKSAIGIEPAPVNSEGFANGTTGTDIRMLELTRDDIQILRDAESTEILLQINTNSDNETVKFCTYNSIRFNVFATFNVLVDL